MDTPSAWSVVTSIASMIVVFFDLVKSALGSLAWPLTVLTGILVFKKDIVDLLSKIASIKVGNAEASFLQGVHQMNPLASAAEAEAKVAVAAAAAAAASEDGEHDQEEQVGENAATTRPEDESLKASEDEKAADSISANAVENLTRDPGPFFKKLLRLSGLNADGSTDGDPIKWAKYLRDYLLANSIDGAAAKDLHEARAIASNSPSGAVLMAWRAIEGILQQVPATPEFRAISPTTSAQRWKNPSFVMRHLMTNSLIEFEAYDRFHELQKLRNSVAHASNFTADPSAILEYIDRAEELAVTLTSVVTRLSTAMQPKPGPPTAP